MALGIGATTTLFSVAYGVLLKPLPWPDADRLVRVSELRGGRADIVGAPVTLDGQPVAVVGVMPRDFAFPDREARLWTAWQVPPLLGQGVLTGVIFSAMARLRDGVTPQQASAEATARARSA